MNRVIFLAVFGWNRYAFVISNAQSFIVLAIEIKAYQNLLSFLKKLSVES